LPRAFNHGLTRNAAIEQARGELVVLLVQDAVPANDSWLAALTAPLLADARLAGTFARQRPRPDASPLTRLYLERTAVAREKPRMAAPLTSVELAALAPMDRLERCTFDNVCSCIRRSVWTRIPFRETPIGEDVEWAKEVLLAGYSLAFTPAAVVVHSHDRSAAYEFDRTYTLHRRLFELFELRTIQRCRCWFEPSSAPSCCTCGCSMARLSRPFEASRCSHGRSASISARGRQGRAIAPVRAGFLYDLPRKRRRRGA
jgi:rhamnosyltransferase